MFDALEDTPRDFQLKLMDALNSLGQTMEIPPTECFDKVLCASDDENPDVKKTMYNWWRAFFEVLGKTSGNLPKDREVEFTEKVDALMAEIMKSGDKEASSDNEVVLEDGYEEAPKADEDDMLKDFDFAVQHIGEIANKVKDIVNFVNPYCEGNTSHCNSKEVDNTMKKNTNERRDSDWVSMNDIVGMEVGESDDGSEFWKSIDDDDYLASRKEQTKEYRTFQVGDKVMWKDPEYDEWTDGWTVISGPEEGFDVYDDMYTIENDDGSEAEVLGCELRLSETMKKMDEASVVVDANDVWDVLDLLDDEVANKNLTDLINSHVRTEEEIMDAIDNCYPDGVRKGELNAYMKDSFYEIVDELGLDVEKFKQDGQFVDPKKPVALEGSEDEQKPDEVKDGEKKYKQDGETKTLVTGSDKENNTNNKQEVTEMTIEQEIDNPWKLSELLWGQGQDNLRELLESGLFDDEFVMQMIEDMEIHDLTAINDAFAYDFETILDMFGCDPHAWSQNLEIKRKGDEDSEED